MLYYRPCRESGQHPVIASDSFNVSFAGWNDHIMLPITIAVLHNGICHSLLLAGKGSLLFYTRDTVHN